MNVSPLSASPKAVFGASPVTFTQKPVQPQSIGHDTVQFSGNKGQEPNRGIPKNLIPKTPEYGATGFPKTPADDRAHFAIQYRELREPAIQALLAEDIPEFNRIKAKWDDILPNSFIRLDLEGIDLSGKNLQGANLSYAFLQGANLSGTNLAGSNLMKADFADANLDGADLTRAILWEAIFRRAKFTNIQQLRNARLSRNDMLQADCSGTDFRRVGTFWFMYALATHLQTAQFPRHTINNLEDEGGNGTRADFERAASLPPEVQSIIAFRKQKEGTAWSPPKRQRINLAGKDLRNVDLSTMDLRAANLRNANLAGKDLRDFDLEKADLTGANLEGADLSDANLVLAQLTGANLKNAILKGSHMWLAKLEGAQLQNANLQHAFLDAANLQNANLQGVDLSFAEMDRVKLQNADLRGATLREVNLGTYLKPERLMQSAEFRQRIQGSKWDNLDLHKIHYVWPSSDKQS